MRPDIGDLLAGIRRTLVECVLPSVTDPFALEQSTFALLALDHVEQRWEGAVRYAKEENAALREFFERVCRRRAESGGQGRDFFARVEAVLGRRTGDGEASYGSLREENAELRGLLGELLAGAAGEAFVAEARRIAKDLVARDREWVRVGEFLW
jgi:hypothetical protein